MIYSHGAAPRLSAMSLRSAKTNARLYYLVALLTFWFLVISLRLLWLQVVDFGDYTQRAARQQQRSIEVSSVRGSIYDRNGNELAMTVNVDSVFAVPANRFCRGHAGIHSTA